MVVPTYDKFIEPLLRYLAGKPDGVPARDAHEAVADALQLDENQRSEVIASGSLFIRTEQDGRMTDLSGQGYRKAYREGSGA